MSSTDSVRLIYTELQSLLAEKSSDDHKRDLKQCIDKFLIYLISKSLYNKPLSEITSSNIEEFLTAFYTDGVKGKYYYNNYRRLNIVFNSLIRKGYISTNVLSSLEFEKKEIDNVSSNRSFFHKITIQKVFDYLKINDQTFYLFASINYYLMIKSTNIRAVKRGNFNADLTRLILNDGKSSIGYEIPDALKKILKDLNIKDIKSDKNIFTGTNDDFPQSTFFKKWKKLRSKMFHENIIDNEDYEFEAFAHSMVYEIYLKNGDIYEIQKLLNRSSTYKTKEYLKNIFGDEFENIIKSGN